MPSAWEHAGCTIQESKASRVCQCYTQESSRKNIEEGTEKDGSDSVPFIENVITELILELLENYMELRRLWIVHHNKPFILYDSQELII
jgi:hypothetical protein